MAWTASITLDADKTDVGTATSTWNAGEATEFSYSRRVKVAVSEGKAFAAEAIAARDEAIAKRAREAALETTLTGMLTAEEAK